MQRGVRASDRTIGESCASSGASCASNAADGRLCCPGNFPGNCGHVDYLLVTIARASEAGLRSRASRQDACRVKAKALLPTSSWRVNRIEGTYMRTIHSTVVAFASVVWLSSSVLLSALAQTTSTPPSKNTTAGTQSNRPPNTKLPPEGVDCETCTFVLERVKKGTNMSLPTICSELQGRKGPDAYSSCHQTLDALGRLNNARNWLFDGCYEWQAGGSKEWRRPCP